mmetsp:Transcript_23305/g.59728  ORF Transcript_23305/g.59728 Transcript_23305/m.59728 type:complete len:247 (+) Transcript_23305:545-1285(+)
MAKERVRVGGDPRPLQQQRQPVLALTGQSAGRRREPCDKRAARRCGAVQKLQQPCALAQPQPRLAPLLLAPGPHPAMGALAGALLLVRSQECGTKVVHLATAVDPRKLPQLVDLRGGTCQILPRVLCVLRVAAHVVRQPHVAEWHLHRAVHALQQACSRVPALSPWRGGSSTRRRRSCSGGCGGLVGWLRGLQGTRVEAACLPIVQPPLAHAHPAELVAAIAADHVVAAARLLYARAAARATLCRR